MPLPSAISLRNHIYYVPPQGQLQCCTSSAVLTAVEITAGMPLSFSRLYLYYMTRKLRGNMRATGVKLKDTLDALSQYGACFESKWPSGINRLNEEPLQHTHDEASKWKLRSYESVSINQYKECLNDGIPIIVGMSTGKLFWNLHGKFEDQNYKPVNGTDNKQTQGHSVVCIGYNDAIGNGSWIISNSLGSQWGFYGYGALPYECGINIGESYIITNFAGLTAGNKKSSV